MPVIPAFGSQKQEVEVSSEANLVYIMSARSRGLCVKTLFQNTHLQKLSPFPKPGESSQITRLFFSYLLVYESVMEQG